LMTLSSVQVDARVTGVTSRRDVSSLSNDYDRQTRAALLGMT